MQLMGMRGPSVRAIVVCLFLDVNRRALRFASVEMTKMLLAPCRDSVSKVLLGSGKSILISSTAKGQADTSLASGAIETIRKLDCATVSFADLPRQS